MLCSVGTGTTLAGIIGSALPNQRIMGFSAVADPNVNEKLQNLYPSHNNWTLHADYTFGGFAKFTHELIDYVYDFYDEYNIALDVVYTAKMMYGLRHLLAEKYFTTDNKILCIHTGGVQGNAGFGVNVYE